MTSRGTEGFWTVTARPAAVLSTTEDYCSRPVRSADTETFTRRVDLVLGRRAYRWKDGVGLSPPSLLNVLKTFLFDQRLGL